MVYSFLSRGGASSSANPPSTSPPLAADGGGASNSEGASPEVAPAADDSAPVNVSALTTSMEEQLSEGDNGEAPRVTGLMRNVWVRMTLVSEGDSASTATARALEQSAATGATTGTNRTMTSANDDNNNADPEVPTTVSNSNNKKVVRTKDIIKIFKDETAHECIQVSPAQLDRVRLMHRRMSDAAQFSFNYNTLLLVASLLAGLGLVSNSSATIIASMLVSPIMGPVVGLAYGSTIRDWKLVRSSMKTECVSLLVCVLSGAVIASCTGWSDLSQSWPTEEMISRGVQSTLYVAIPVAFISGLGVAVSLLDEQTSSLVGVAISASLLPPAVNAGVLWVCHAFVKADVIGEVAPLPPIWPPARPQPYPFPYYDNNNNATQPSPYGTGKGLGDIEMCDPDDPSCSYEVKEYFQMGLTSLFITLANIALIWVSSMLMFRMKEVLPIEKSVFWTDLGIARKVYQRRAVLQRAQIKVSGASTESGINDEEENSGNVPSDYKEQEG